MKTHPRRGFTIIELAVIVAIIAVLVGIVTVLFVRSQEEARDRKREADISAIMTALENYYTRNGEYPMDTALYNWSQSGGPLFNVFGTTANTVTLGPSTTHVDIQRLFPGLNNNFGDPSRTNSNEIFSDPGSGVYTLNNPRYLYLVGGVSLSNGSSGASFYVATKVGQLRCDWNATKTTYSSMSYIIGYYSEAKDKWIFRYGINGNRAFIFDNAAVSSTCLSSGRVEVVK